MANVCELIALKASEPRTQRIESISYSYTNMLNVGGMLEELHKSGIISSGQKRLGARPVENDEVNKQ